MPTTIFQSTSEFLPRASCEKGILIYNIKMAKSLRSKWKQKMKAVKRVRYDAKATETLKKILAIQQIREQEEEAKKDAEMKEKEPTSTEKMDVEKDIYNVKTMRNSKNQYPEWITKKQKRHVSAKALKKKKAKGKKLAANPIWKKAIS
ncbi:hypothetical protein QYM36_000807 [Artemia franciscana]|uniref:Uncharacterized protein n=1 Tax=Artemia franciscana TaxID=6661 RepID=A0AA88ITJ1_ARTSF|nr:hypothetical protein QYM36_000807 [Artemia franciscana]